jgi:signal transduction histidine kinase
MVGRVGRRSPQTRIIILAASLILAPGIILGYLGFRSIANRAETLRRNYSATVGLIRDRLDAEVERLESDAAAAADTFLAVPRSMTDLQGWLDARSTEHPWLTSPFFLHDSGGVVTAALSSGWPQPADGGWRTSTALASLLQEAERAEFAFGRLDEAVALNRAAARSATSEAGRCLALTRTGRTLVKSGRFAEGVAAYAQARDVPRDVTGPAGAPCRVIALIQMVEGLSRMGLDDERRRRERELIDELVEAPWDLQRLYGLYLDRFLDVEAAPPALRARAGVLLASVADTEWLRVEVAPRLQAIVSQTNGDSAAHGHLLAARENTPVPIGYRRFAPGSNPGEVVAFGYGFRAEYVGDVVLPQLLAPIELGGSLAVGIQDEQGRWRSPDLSTTPAGQAPDAVLADARLQQALPGWRVALVDPEGRSLSDIVGRENRLYGASMVLLVAVLAAGVTFTVRAASREVELSRLRSEFVAHVTHDLKTPLALIRMYSETLESGLGNEAQRNEFLTVIRRESERLTHLINNVLDFRKVDSGTREFAFTRENLVALVRDAVEAYGYFFDRAGVTVETTWPSGPLVVSVDRDAMAQALLNLLQNALKHGAAGRYVGVTVGTGGDDALVSVIDRGRGIPASEHARIFEKYHRVDTREVTGGTGSGLGLAIVKHTVEAHGGRVEVTSAPGSGSTFTMRLPLADAQIAGEPARSEH